MGPPGGPQSKSKRRFSINDCVAYPGVSNFKNPLQNPQTDGLVIGYDAGRGATETFKLIIDENGFRIGDGTEELLQIMLDFMVALRDGFFGPYPMNAATILAVDAIINRLNTIKG